jgi:tetratricopeptide (TPR) repeat protein
MAGGRSIGVGSWLERVARWSLAAVVVLSVQALGSIPPLALLLVTGLATVSAAASLAGRRLSWRLLPGPVWLILGLTAYTTLQALPLPAGLVGAVAPANREVWDGAFELLGEATPGWLSLSLDPGATWIEVAKGWLYAAVFLAATAVGARRGSAYGATVLLVSSALLAVVCLAHGLSEATHVFGFYAPSTRGSGFGVAPLLNPNNRASYLNFGVVCASALLTMRNPPGTRWLPALAIPAMLGVSLLSGSRGGLLGLVVGLGALAVALWPLLQRRREAALPWRQLVAIAGLLFATGAVFALTASGGRLRHLLFEQNTSKLATMAASLKLVPAHPWSGIGRGSFESVFPALRTATDNTISSHPENFVVQWLTEWGIPVALVALVGSAVLLRPRYWGIKRSIAACGLLCAALSLAVQNLVDLGSEVPGVMTAGAAAAGFAWGARAGTSPRRSEGGWSASIVALAAGALLLTIAARQGMHPVGADRDWLRERYSSVQGWPQFRADVRTVMLRHPAEPYFPRLAAVAAWQSGDQNPVPWLGRALSRGVSAGRTHYILGGYLASRGKRAQALLELRMAATYDPSLSGPIAKVALKLTKDADELERCVPEGRAGARLLTALAKNLATSEPLQANTLLRRAVQRDPTATDARLSLARRLLDDLEHAQGGCEQDGGAACLNEVTGLLAEAPANNPEVVKLRARRLLAAGSAQDALKLLSDACRAMQRPLPCIASWVEAARRARDGKALRQAAVALESEDCSSTQQQCDAIYWAAGLAARTLGENELALRYLERSAGSEHSAARWREVARVARDSGQPARAANALARARALNPQDPTISAELDATRRDTVEQILRK